MISEKAQGSTAAQLLHQKNPTPERSLEAGSTPTHPWPDDLEHRGIRDSMASLSFTEDEGQLLSSALNGMPCRETAEGRQEEPQQFLRLRPVLRGFGGGAGQLWLRTRVLVYLILQLQ